MAGNHSFSGKRVLVTGGGQGIGYEIAKRFYDDGAIVFIIDKNQTLLDNIINEMPKVTTFCVDITNWHETQAVVMGLTPLDHLVNNAGVMQAELLLEATPEVFDLTFGVNVRGMLAVAQAFVKGNIVTGHAGTIVNMSSIGDRVAFWGGGIYATSKAAVTRLTMAMALEFTKYNVRTNCVNPCFIETPLLASIPPEIIHLSASISERIPIKEKLLASDIANSVFFLSSPASGQINGISLLVDGGCRAAN